MTKKLALTNVTVIDVTDGSRHPGQTVLTRGNRITRIAPYGKIQIPEGAQVVDLTGKFLIPGLADMHIHADGPEQQFLPLFIATGVTTVRQMWGSPMHHDWRRRIEAGTLLGPRFVIGSRIVDGKPSLWDNVPMPAPPVRVGTETEARQAVREAKDGGAEFVKVYSRLSRGCYRAIIDEAARLDIPVAGHVPDALSVTETSDFGQRSFEHVHGLWPATSRLDKEMLERMAGIDPGEGHYNEWFHQIHAIEWDAALSYSAVKAAKVFDRLISNDSAYVPTLVLHDILDRPYLAPVNDKRLRFMPEEMKRMHTDYVLDDLFTRGRTSEESTQQRVLFERRLETVRAMAEAGVRLMAGTDLSGTPLVLPGFSLHEELELFTRAGLSTLHALQTATLEPARFLGQDHTSGTIEEGKLADLVVLDADPLLDITNTQRIHAVIAAGRLIDPTDRQRLFDEAEDFASASAAA